MSFVSYAQNFEDVMLWRALKHVQNGLYVDVGAQHPIIDSVSKAFYEHGWRGIHIEPVPYYAQLLRQDRPDEVVLEIALSDTEGTLEFNVIAKTGLSTAVNAYALLHHNERGFDFQRIQVPVLTLRSALHSIEGKDVHWLKIDVEGFEENVLKGWDSQALRPWIMVIEATVPNSSEVDFANWDPLLTSSDYQFVYFDGLNRFYVAQEHIELAKAFSCPPNVFDSVVLSGQATSELCRGLIELDKEKEFGWQVRAQQPKSERSWLKSERSKPKLKFSS
jgi:FkbM family methyltransferase